MTAGTVKDEPSRPRRVGRRVAQAIYYLAVVGLAGASAYQITRQVFFPAQPAEPPPFTTCRQGLTSLYDSLERGHRAAEESVGEDSDEEAALVRFRAALEPTWRYRDTVARMCQDDPQQRGSLDAIERLRYSEEHGVRHQAAELTNLRRRVRTLVRQRLGR